MGIPSFYKWLVNRYPSIVSPAEEPEKESPDGIIYDNLYIDMNYIIHNCFHPQDNMYVDIDVCPPMSVSEVFESMFEYLDDLLCIVRPRRLLYLAVDSVAPCAKMNRLRRGRRFIYGRSEAIAEEVSDPHVITPGTEFMEKLSQALEYHIRARLNSDPGWKDIMVILSDANVPGEGEHKIMSFIRAQRSMKGYDPNTRHCLFGHDADLIMLALASHEVHFSILREDVLLSSQAEDNSQTEDEPEAPYLFLNIWVLREYLEIELEILDPICEPNIERLIDDFVFICFLVGNDFIPPIPSLHMRECALDLLIEVYKTTFNTMGGYIVNTDKVKDKHAAYLEVSRLEIFFHELSVHEEKIFLKRYKLQLDSLQKSYRDKLREASENEGLELNKKLEDLLLNEEHPYDRVRLGFPGWKYRFFEEYFGVKMSGEIGNLQNDMAQKYLEGLCWVLQCYFTGVPSWSWYYPFYVAPFVSDLKDLSRFEISFTLDKPLRPFDQLMAVSSLPRWYALLPKCYEKVMGLKSFDYPKLEEDMNGKRFWWNGISEEKLLLATKAVDKELTMHEMARNTPRQQKIFLQRNSNAQELIEAIVQTSSSCPQQKIPIDSATSGIGGWLSPNDSDGLSNGFFPSPIEDLPDITNDQAISATFFNPEVMNPIPRLLGNVKVPDKNVSGADISRRPLWHIYPGSRPPPPPRISIQRPDTIWKPSTPPTPREEHKNAGTGWLGRGRGNAIATAETQHTSSSSSSSSSRRYGRGHGSGKGTAAETQWGGSGSSYSYSRGFHRLDMAPSRGSSSRWRAGSSSGDGGAGHGVTAPQSSLGW